MDLGPKAVKAFSQFVRKLSSPPPPDLPSSDDGGLDGMQKAVILAVALCTVTTLLVTYGKRLYDGGTLSRWKQAADMISTFAGKMNLADEINFSGYALPLAANLGLLAAVQGTNDPRKATATGSKAALTARCAEGAHFMRFASSAYGSALMLVFGLIPARTSKQMAQEPEVMEGECICEHTGVVVADLVKLDTVSLDVTGDAECLRHLIVVDHAKKAVVLALRGTASISDVVHDIVAHAAPFCGGMAHAGMAGMAKAVWKAAGAQVVETLAKHPGYELVVTGHSLGAGTSGLLVVLLYYLRNSFTSDASLPKPPPSSVNIRGFCFAPPPVFAPLEKAPNNAIPAISAFVYGDDCVPFLSVRAGREMFAAMHACDEACKETPKKETLYTIAEKTPPASAMCLSAKARADALPNLEAAPEMFMPAGVFVWMRPAAAKGAYDAVECDTCKVAEAVTGGIPLGAKMLLDHMTDGYEASLNFLGKDP